MSSEYQQQEIAAVKNELRLKMKELGKCKTELIMANEEHHELGREIRGAQVELELTNEKFKESLNQLKAEKENTHNLQKKLRVCEMKNKNLEEELNRVLPELTLLKNAVRPALLAMKTFERNILEGTGGEIS